MHKPIRLLALDLDGTLIRVDETVSSTNQLALHAAKSHGIEPTIATGRLFHERVEHLIKELDIRLPVATLNGGAIFSPDGKLLRVNVLSSLDVLWLAEQAGEIEGIRWWGCTTDTVLSGLEAVETAVVDHIVKMGFECDNPAELSRFRKRLEAEGRFQLTRPHPEYLEVNVKGVHKASALAFICQAHGIAPEEAAAMGDGPNDYEMLTWAGYSFAMENGEEELKAVATEVTLRHDEDGVAHAIRKLVRLQAAGA